MLLFAGGVAGTTEAAGGAVAEGAGDVASVAAGGPCFFAGTPVQPPSPNGEPAPLPVAHSGADPGFHPLDVQKREASGDKIILTGINPATGKQETVIGKAGRDTVYDLGDPNGKLKTGVIENVRTGDYVATRKPITGQTEFRRVVQTHKPLAYETITAQFADAKTGKIVDTLTATPEHPFFVPGRGPIPLGQLGIGTQVVTRAGPTFVIASLVKHEYPQGVPVYNFEVQGDHTYFVGVANGGTWVHNTCVEPDLKNLDSHALNSMAKRGWTPDDIMEAYRNGEQFPAEDLTSRLQDGPPSAATRFVHPDTGASVIINNSTGRVIHVGLPGYQY
jgi:hypothetical protein